MHVFIIVIYSNPMHVRTVIDLLLVECSLKPVLPDYLEDTGNK